MEIDLSQLLDSKIFVKENSGMNFLTPKEYVEPFIEIAQKSPLFNQGTVKVLIAEPVVNENADETKNISYPKMSLEFMTPSALDAVGFKQTMGLVYNLNVSVPTMKVFTGANVVACMNLTIFSADNVFSQNMTNNYFEVYNKAEKYLESREKDAEHFLTMFEKLRTTQLSSNELDRTIGKLLNSSHKLKLGTTPIVGASKLLHSPDSKYYVGRGEDYACSLWNVYNAVTQVLTNSTDIVEKPLKTVQLAELILN